MAPRPSLHPCLPSAHVPGVAFLFLEAADADEPGTANSDLRFHILSQAPAQPFPDMFQLEHQQGALALSPKGERQPGGTGREDGIETRAASAS